MMMFDQGIFNQIMWSLTHGHGFRSTIEVPGNHLLVHFSPTLILVAPWVALLRFHPLALVMISVVCTWGSVLAWMAIVRKHPDVLEENRPFLEVLVLAMGAFFDSFWANLHWGFHEAHLAMLAVSWGLYFWICNKDKIAILLLCLGALCKEIYLLDIALLFIAMAWVRRARRWNYLVLSIALILVFFAYSKWNSEQVAQLPFVIPKGYLIDFFKHHYGYLGVTSIADLVKSSFLRPTELLTLWWTRVGVSGRWWFPLSVFAAFGFAFFMGGWRKKRSAESYRWLVLGVVPSFATILLAEDGKLSDFGFQYVLLLWPVLFFVSVPGFQASPWGIRYLPAWVAILVSFWSGGNDYWKMARHGFLDYLARRPFLTELEKVKPAESVLSDQMGQTLSARYVVQSPPHLQFFEGFCPDWIISTSEQFAPDIKLVRSKCRSEYSFRFEASGMVGYKKL
jgi:uncharacterized membrane protein